MDFLIGVICASMVLYLYHWTMMLLFTDGELKIDPSNPDKDVYLFEIKDLGKLSKKRRLVIKVNPDADLTQN